MEESTAQSNFDVLRCPRCARKAEGLLIPTTNGLKCSEPNCGLVYPVQDGVAVMLTYEGDFYHLRKALSPAEIRVQRQTSE